jgi:hypothetical protein
LRVWLMENDFEPFVGKHFILRGREIPPRWRGWSSVKCSNSTRQTGCSGHGSTTTAIRRPELSFGLNRLRMAPV